MPASEVLDAMTESWMSDWMEERDGFPGLKRNVLAALRRVRRNFQAEDRV